MTTDLSGRFFKKRTINGNSVLVPADFHAEDFMAELKEDQGVLIDAKRPRSPENHAHFFAILHKAMEHLEGFEDEDALLDAIKIAVGHVRPQHLVDGTIVFLPKSIRFAAMDEVKFKRFKERALFVLTSLLGFDAMTLLPEVDRYTRKPRGRKQR